MKKILAYAFLFFAALAPRADSFDSAFGRAPEVSAKEADAIKEAAAAATQDEAEKILAEAALHKWAGAAVFFNLGNVRMNKGNTDAAIGDYKKALEKIPSFFAAQKNLAFAYARKNDEKAAFSEMKKTLALSGGGDVQTLLWFVSYHASRRDFSAALSLCNQALIYDPSDSAAQSAKAAFLCELGNYAESEKICLNILGAGYDERAAKILGRARAMRGDYVGAISVFEILRKNSKLSAAEVSFLADLYFKKELYKIAAERYLEGGNFASAENAAYAQIKSGDAEAALKTSAALKSPQARKVRGVAYMTLGDNAAAHSELSGYLKDSPADSYAALCLANVCLRLERFLEAEECFARASEDPNLRLSAQYGILRSCAARGDFKKALALAQSISKKYPDEEISDYVKYLRQYVSEME